MAVFTASGPTGHLPVQPFTVDLDNSGIAIKARGNAGGGFAFLGDNTANTIQGFRSGDTLRGYGGNDRLDGGAGNDALYGGTGSDTFVMSVDMGGDRVFDFNPADDHIELAGINHSDLRIRQIGASTTDIRGPQGERLILNGILPDQLSPDMFIRTDAHTHSGHILI